MAVMVWETTRTTWCTQKGQEAALLEQRVYSSEVLPDVGAPYRVRARKCSLGVECSLAGCNCRWAFSNPNYDPFA